MNCPKCKGNKVVKQGLIKTKVTNVAKQRYRCKKCKSNFVERDLNYRKKTPLWLRDQIKRLYGAKRGYVNKLSKKDTYSTRDIAKKFNVSKSFVWNVVKNLKSLIPKD